MLLRAEKIARSAQAQILLRNAESVVGLAQHGQPLARHLAARIGKQQAIRLMLPAPHASAQLMQLRKTKALCVFHRHDRCVRNIDPDLDHRGRHQDLDLIFRKCMHDRLFLARLHFSMQHSHAHARKHLARKAGGIFLGGFDIQRLIFLHKRADDIDLPPLLQLAHSP